MEEIKMFLQAILEEMQTINANLEEIKGEGLYNSISDVYDKVEDIQDAVKELQGNGLYNSINDVCNKLVDLELTIKLGDNY